MYKIVSHPPKSGSYKIKVSVITNTGHNIYKQTITTLQTFYTGTLVKFIGRILLGKCAELLMLNRAGIVGVLCCLLLNDRHSMHLLGAAVKVSLDLISPVIKLCRPCSIVFLKPKSATTVILHFQGN